jgi:pentatricopeptide repeat protein
MYETMKTAYSIQPDERTYRNLIFGAARSGLYEMVVSVYKEMEVVACELDTTLSIGPVDSWSKGENGQRRGSVWCEGPVLWPLYNETLRACSKTGDWQTALRIMSVLAREGRTDVVQWGAAIAACGPEGRWGEALMLLRDMEEGAHVEPNEICYSAAISAAEKGGQWRVCLNLLLKMISKGMSPDVIAYNSAISGSAKCGEWHMSLKLFREWRRVKGARGVA